MARRRIRGSGAGRVKADGKAGAGTPARRPREQGWQCGERQDEGVKGRPPRYDFQTFEEKWRARWEDSGVYRVDLRTPSGPTTT